MQQIQHELAIDIKLHEIIVLIHQLLLDLVAEGTPCNSIFNSQAIPNIELDDFLRRIHKFTQFSKECLIIAVIYIDRYNMRESEFVINRYNVHKLLLACLLLATKFQDDFYYDNKAFELAGGVNISQLHVFEL
jgi:hypothetical protein